jgi:hypothetical protein
MSYYDDSSLFVAPNGYKTSVLFAQKPMDANGQLAFTRSNDTATRVGPDGLIEKVRTNLILQSNTFSNASWTNNTLVTANNQISPDGTLDASTFTSDGAYHGVLQSLTITSVPHTFSIYAKAGNYSIFRIVNVSSLTNVAWFNLSTGVTSGAIGGTSKIEAVGNGWFRCSYSTNSPNTSTTNQGFVLSDAMGSLGGVPSGSTMYFWKSQVETGDIATDYIPTTTTAVSVGPVANLPRIDYTGGGCGKLLLEPQRTNVITFSEQFTNAIWNNSSAVTRSISGFVSPQGVLNAYDIIPTTANANHTLRAPNLSGFTSGAVVSVSFFAKANGYKFISVVGGFGSSSTPAVSFNVEQGTITSGTGTIEDYGNGWYRCSLPITLNATSLFCVATILDNNQSGSFAGDGTSGISVYGFQIEVGSYSTSYIPTLGAASTRGADACIKTGIASLIGQSEGTIFLDFIYKPVFDTTQTSYRASISDGTYTGRVSILAENSNTLSVVITGVSLTGSTFPIVDGQRYKVAIGYGATTDVYINGAKVYSYSSGTPTGTYTRFQFSDAVGLASRAFAGPINQALLFKTCLSNSELASLTTL